MDVQQDAIELQDSSDNEGDAAVQQDRGTGRVVPRRYLYSEHVEQFNALRDAAELQQWDRRSNLSELTLSWQEEGLTWW